MIRSTLLSLGCLAAAGSVSWSQCEGGVATPPVLTTTNGFPRGIVHGGNRLLAGAVFDSTFAQDAGTLEVFRRQGKAWVHEAKLTGSLVSAFDAFGGRNAYDDGRIAAGCYQCDVGASIDGAVFVFEHDGSGWVETAVLRQSAPAEWDQFGTSVDLEGDTIVAGAWNERVYVFEEQGGVWTETQELAASDGFPGADFGLDLALSGDTLLVGSADASDGSGTYGAVYVFERSGGAWTETDRLVVPGLGPHSHFGSVVELDGDVAVITATGALDGDGEVYVFERAGGAWSLVAQFGEPDPTEIVNFGHSIALEGDRFVTSETRFGPLGGHSLHVYERGADGWEEALEIPLPYGLGVYLSVSGDELASGLFAPDVDSVQMFDLPPVVTLAADVPSVSLSAGGTQGLALAAGPCQAGSLYWVLGSATGTSPGLELSIGVLPLVPDAYMQYTVSHANDPPLVDTLGFLDAFGRGAAAIDLAPGTAPGLAGLTLYHAAVVFEPGSLALELITDGTELDLAP